MFDEENAPEGYGCECGGSILLYDGMWCCDECEFKAPDNKKIEKDNQYIMDLSFLGDKKLPPISAKDIVGSESLADKLPELLCKSKLDEGAYDDIIREHLGVILRDIMTLSKGTENPSKVMQRIRSLVV